MISHAHACVRVFKKQLNAFTDPHAIERYTHYIETYEQQAIRFTERLNDLMRQEKLAELQSRLKISLRDRDYWLRVYFSKPEVDGLLFSPLDDRLLPAQTVYEYAERHDHRAKKLKAELNELYDSLPAQEVLPSSYRKTRPIEQDDQSTNILDVSIPAHTPAIEATKQKTS